MNHARKPGLRHWRLPARGLVPLAVAALVLGVRYDAGAAALQKNGDGVLVEKTQGLPDLARGRQATATGRLDDAEADLKPLAERGYVEAQIALGKLYARIGTPDRIAAAIVWLRTARKSTPEPTEVPLGRLLARENDEASLSEGEALLSSAWARREDPEALAGLIRLYSEHPERDTQRRVADLVVRAGKIRQPDTQAAVIGWYRSTPQMDGHRDQVAALCERWLENVPECYVDLARVARAGNDDGRLKKLVHAAGEKYEQGIVQPQTLASLARVLVEEADESAEADAVAPAALPVKIFDVPEDEGEGSVSTLQARLPSGAARACASDPLIAARLDTAAPDAPVAAAAPALAPGPAAQPDLANTLLGQLLKGRDDAPVLAAGVVARYPYLLPGIDIEASLKQGLERGVPEARLYLGQLYLVGARAPRNAQLALQYLQQAADEPATALQGHYFLGRLYQYGYLDESKPLLAAEHLMWAARRGYVAADGALARLFANGKGMCPNPINAYVFAKLGAREGSASTAALQQQLAAVLMQAQVSQADQLFGAELQARPSAYEIPRTLLAQEGEAVRDARAADAQSADMAATADVDTASPPALASAAVAATPSAPEAAAVAPETMQSVSPPARREMRLSHTPSRDAATRALLQADTVHEIDYQVPVETPAAAPAPVPHAAPSGDKS
ncbi:MAG: tetratricopeptide repeat protein [Solimonas sp.]